MSFSNYARSAPTSGLIFLASFFLFGKFISTDSLSLIIFSLIALPLIVNIIAKIDYVFYGSAESIFDNENETMSSVDSYNNSVRVKDKTFSNIFDVNE